jgi:hypothetical protein
VEYLFGGGSPMALQAFGVIGGIIGIYKIAKITAGEPHPKPSGPVRGLIERAAYK